MLSADLLQLGADCLIVAGTLGAGIWIGADCVALSAREHISAAYRARDRAIKAAKDAQALAAERAIELEMVEEQLALSDAAARGAQHLAQSWESRAQILAAALEERCGPEIVEPSDTVVLFRRGHGFGGFG